ncbi:MAG: hypothetical protein WC853_02180 [Thermodesulfovibrionales bacterium]
MGKAVKDNDEIMEHVRTTKSLIRAVKDKAEDLETGFDRETLSDLHNLSNLALKEINAMEIIIDK